MAVKLVPVVAALLLAACSGGTSESATTLPLPRLADREVDWLDAVDRTRNETRLSVRTEVAAGQLGAGTVIRDVYDLDLVLAHSTVDYDGQQQEEMIIDGETGWVRLAVPAFANSLPDGVRYVEATTVELVGAGLVNFDPERAMPLLYALAGASATEVIEEPDGRLSYSVDIDPALLAARIPAHVVPSFRATIGDLLDPNRAAAIDATVSLDNEGRIVFLLIEMTPHRPEPNPNPELYPQLLIQLEIDFGEPVEVDAPDPETVIHIDDIPNLRATLARAPSPLRRTSVPP